MQPVLVKPGDIHQIRIPFNDSKAQRDWPFAPDADPSHKGGVDLDIAMEASDSAGITYHVGFQIKFKVDRAGKYERLTFDSRSTPFIEGPPPWTGLEAKPDTPKKKGK